MLERRSACDTLPTGTISEPAEGQDRLPVTLALAVFQQVAQVHELQLIGTSIAPYGYGLAVQSSDIEPYALRCCCYALGQRVRCYVHVRLEERQACVPCITVPNELAYEARGLCALLDVGLLCRSLCTASLLSTPADFAPQGR